MTLQQLQYIISLNRHRSFAKAAETCGVTQPTLSKMIAKLEDELDVRIFSRTNKYVEPTSIGRKIIAQAEKVATEVGRIEELVAETKDHVSGYFRLSVGPSIAPYILPDFIRIYESEYTSVSLAIEEMRIENMFESLLSNNIDAGIAIGGKSKDGIFEIPLYQEPFWVYLAENCRRKLPVFSPEQLSHENMWIMKEAQCLRESAFSFCKAKETGRRVYEAGNIETLVRVVDANGGFTIIPEMHIPLLNTQQKENVRPLAGDHRSRRKVSIYIRHDYVREKLLNTVIATIIKIIPSHMIENSIVKYGVRL